MSAHETQLCELLEIAAYHLDIRGDLLGVHNDSGADLAHYLLARIPEIRENRLSLVHKQELLDFFSPASEWDNTTNNAAFGQEIHTLVKQLYLLDIAQAFQKY